MQAEKVIYFPGNNIRIRRRGNNYIIVIYRYRERPVKVAFARDPSARDISTVYAYVYDREGRTGQQARTRSRKQHGQTRKQEQDAQRAEQRKERREYE